MERGSEEIVATLAILRCGAAYLPLDPKWPLERRLTLLDQSGVKVVLTQQHLKDIWPSQLRLFFVESSIEGEELLVSGSRSSPEDLAYVIFTSGSAGKPKGVMIHHDGASNTIRDINYRFLITPRDRLLSVSPLTFDLSVYDIFGALAAGALLVLPPISEGPDPNAWCQLIEQHQITIWNSVPALAELLAEVAEEKTNSEINSIRLFLLSGDWIPLTLPERLRKLCPNSRVISLGGATEASIWSIAYPIEHINPAWRSIPYGRPLADQEFYVLNRGLESCPIDVPGELYIGGRGVARGYCGDPEQTASHFLNHPRTQQRLYRTGDLGRYLSDGNIEFLGRIDSYLKVHGYRIEAGEIETALRGYPEVRDVVVISRANITGSPCLIAFYVPEPGSSPKMEDLRTYLATKVPASMIPGQFIPVKNLPLTANGKVDRNALTRLPDEEHLVESFLRPRTELERTLCEVWSDVLGGIAVGMTDDFFSLGGNSIASVRICLAARRKGIALLPQNLFQHRTVADLADWIESEQRTMKQGYVSGQSGALFEFASGTFTPDIFRNVLAELSEENDADGRS